MTTIRNIVNTFKNLQQEGSVIKCLVYDIIRIKEVRKHADLVTLIDFFKVTGKLQSFRLPTSITQNLHGRFGSNFRFYVAWAVLFHTATTNRVRPPKTMRQI